MQLKISAAQRVTCEMFDFMDCVLHYKADTRGAVLTGGAVRDSPGMRGVKEDAACEAYLVHVANFPEVLWGGGLLTYLQITVRLRLPFVPHLRGFKKYLL